MLDNTSYTIIRTSLASDFQACAQMMAGSDPWLRMGLDVMKCLSSFEGDYREVYLLKSPATIIGFVIIQPKGSFKGYIQTLCVAEQYRGKKVGSRLLEFAEKQILSYSPNIFICVSSFNVGALRLYERSGFELVGAVPDFIQKGFTELLLRKTVGPVAGYFVQPNNNDQ